jgi:NAD(P)-dependent dehydrogenase (short-subunit alcohol dehydrogenase family)
MATTLESFSLDNKTVIVTGGTRRYGHAFCDGLAEAGATVALTSRSLQRAQETADEFRERGRDAHGYRLDLADDEQINALVDDVLDDHGAIDVLVNSARYLPSDTWDTIDREELDAVFDVGIVGTILITRRVVNEMKPAGGGVIINIGSIYGMGGQIPAIYRNPDEALTLDYPMQKGGMINWTRQLATTLADDGIRANCLSLGGLREESHDEYFITRYNERTPMSRMARADDVKGPIVFLASEASAYMTGVNVVVDGGWTAW